MKLRLKFASNSCHLAEIRRELRAFIEAAGFSELDGELMVLAIDEACTNIIRYAYSGSPERTIRLSADRGPGYLRFVLRDYGESCKPENIRGRSLTDFRPGGLGVRIIQTAFDKVEYCPMRRGTRLTLIRHVQAPAAADRRHQ